MITLFQPEVATEIKRRLNTLTPTSQRLWGKMDAAQMMWHCKEALGTATDETTIKAGFIVKLLRPIIKKSIMSAKPYKPGLPTAKEFVVSSGKDFEIEKQALLQQMDKFIAAEKSLEGKAHPAFGKFTAQEWGYSQWKHLDHHLKQFGV